MNNPDMTKLYNIARKVSGLNKCTGATPAKAVVSELKTAIGGINDAYDKVFARFGNQSNMPEACEWLLDNRYLAVREANTAASAFGRKKTLRSGEGGIIILEACKALVGACGDKLSDECVKAFFDGYQTVSVFPGEELGLIPAALRTALIIRLRELCDTLLATNAPEELSESFAGVFTSLRYLGGLDAGSLIESIDVCERLLRDDPAGIYQRMDDAGRAYYRDRLSQLAKRNRMEEHKLASHILKLCENAVGEARHVGHYLFTETVGTPGRTLSGAVYIAANVLLTLFLTVLCGFLSHSAAAAALLLIPLSELTKTLIDYIILLWVPPRRLPRLALSEGVPDDCATVCVISALITSPDSGKMLAQRLEDIYLTNRRCGKNLRFGILADLPEADSSKTDKDAELINSAAKAVAVLNERYNGGFYLFTRRRVPDDTGCRFSGSERKRGAVMALAALLCGKDSELKVSAGNAGELSGTRYIITLDSDTVPTPDSLSELIGAIAHPLNKPVLDRERGMVASGHGIIHPRMSYEPESVSATDFSRIFAGSGGIEPYSVLAGELYFDLYGRGGFSGKGIIDAESLYVCSDAHIPKGLVLSHDAIEGAYLRGGYMSDTEFTDSFPSSPIAFYRRSHRWTRGDWQNAGWIFGKNGLCDVDRFKLFDSLRRSLVAPSTFAAIAAGLLSSRHGLMTAAWAAIIALAVHLLIALTEYGTVDRRNVSKKYHSRLYSGVRAAFIQTLLRLWLLPYEAWISVSAAATSLWRMLVSHKNLLEWETAAQSELKKRSIMSYYLNMWLCPAAGVLLILTGSVAPAAVGLFWILAPLAAIALSLPHEKSRSVSDDDREYLTSCAKSIWSYYDTLCSPDDNFLPPDNYQEQPPTGIAHRTSPTNIGFCLVSALCAVKLGIDREGRAVSLISNMLDTLEKMQKFSGHFANWYDTRTLRPLTPRYISTVDSGNLYASLIVLKNGLIKLNKPGLAARVNTLAEAMDFSVLYCPGRRLFHIGLDIDKNKLSPSFYDLMASESRLTSYLAVAKGDVPREHWRRLSRAMRQHGGYKGMASWTGTMFEYLMPELFLPLIPDTLLYETAHCCVYVQRHRQTESGLWGISESAFFSLDPALNYRYKAHGCAALALKRGQDMELVISPYSSFLALSVEPKAALENIRRADNLGLYGKYGFIEAVDFSTSRSRSSDGEPVRCYMAHHLGMSMLALTDYLCDYFVVRLFMEEPAMRAYRGLLAEKLPLNAPVITLPEGEMPKTDRLNAGQWAKRGSDIDFEDPESAVLSNGSYNIMLTESGISRSSCGDMLIAAAPHRQIGEGHGTELFLQLGEERISLLPEHNNSEGFIWEFSEISCQWQCERDELRSKTSVAVSGFDKGELRIAELNAKEDIGSFELVFSFAPALAEYNDYVNHPAFWRLGIESKTVDNCLILRRLPRGRQKECFLCLTSDKALRFTSERLGDNGSLAYPFVTATYSGELKQGEIMSIKLALCVGDSAGEAITGAEHMLCIGPSEYGAMPSVCAAVTGMDARETDCAMTLIRHMWFTHSKSPAPSKSSLWKYGISGDMPLAVCPAAELTREKAASLTKQLCLLRSCGVPLDMVLIADEDGEYNRPIYGAVRDTLAVHGLEPLLGAPGGIRILPQSAEKELTAAAAYVYGSNASPRSTDRQYTLPKLYPRSICAVPRYGYDKENSFVFYVNRELPPKVWSLILTNGSMGYMATDCGCGNMWLYNARELRLTPWVNDPYAVSGPESLEYISPTGRYSVFAASDGIPCRIKYGFGFAVWEKNFGATGIRCTAFVPQSIDARVLIIEVCGNQTGQLAWKNELLLSSDDDDRIAVETNYVNSIFRATSSRSPIPDMCFKAAFSDAPISWTCDLFSWYRRELDGKTGDLSVPVFAAVFNVRPVGVIVCGCCDDEILLSLCKPDAAFAELERTKEHWRKTVLGFRVYGDRCFSHYMDGWAAYQTVACRILGRCSVYQSGGATGFRDQLQDAVNMIMLSPAYARSQILTSCAHQYPEGDVMHWWHSMPDGDRGVRTRCSDDLLWLAWALCEYVEKTGDSSICDERVHYVNSKPLSPQETDRYEKPLRTSLSETVLDHAARALDCCVGRGTGVHGLLLFGSCDWNDGMDKVRGESVWLSFFFAHTARRFADLLFELCRPESDKYRALALSVGSAADRAWDGTHYLRGYWSDGSPLGSDKSDECRIDSIAQSWAAFCADASNSRIDMALDTAISRLYDRENGMVKLFDPPFHDPVRDPGYIKSYGMGFRENGGQYTHAAIWLAMACLRRGRASDGYSMLCDLIPHDIERYLAEPYVIAADVSSARGHTGEAGWTWYTGSSGWYFRVIAEELLGLRIRSGMLYIRPSLPPDAPEYRLNLTTWGGNGHEIVINGEEILLDGEKYDGKGIPYC